MREIKVDVGVPGLHHLGGNRLRHVVTRGELGQWMVSRHEPLSKAIPKKCTLASNRFRHEMCAEPAMYRTVGWNCMNSMSRSWAPRETPWRDHHRWRWRDLWFRDRAAPLPPVARTTDRAQTNAKPRRRSQTNAPRHRPS